MPSHVRRALPTRGADALAIDPATRADVGNARRSAEAVPVIEEAARLEAASLSDPGELDALIATGRATVEATRLLPEDVLRPAWATIEQLRALVRRLQAPEGLTTDELAAAVAEARRLVALVGRLGASAGGVAATHPPLHPAARHRPEAREDEPVPEQDEEPTPRKA